MSDTKFRSIEVMTAEERFKAYRVAKGIPESATLLHAHKMLKFEEQERRDLRNALAAANKAIAELHTKLEQAQKDLGNYASNNIELQRQIGLMRCPTR